MVEQGYYQSRINKLEMRKADLTGKLLTTKLSLKAIDNEINACEEAIDNLTHVMNDKADNKDKHILKLQKELDNSKKEVNDLKTENTQLKHDLQTMSEKNEMLECTVKELQYQLSCESDNDVILADNFGQDNIFKELI